MNKVLEFPYGRIRQQPEEHTAKILVLPVRNPPVDILALPMVFALAWLSAFGF